MPLAANHSTVSRQRTRPVTCSTSLAAISAGSVSGLTVTLATTGTTGARISTPASAARITSAAGEHRPRLRPHAPGLRQRLWYGGCSLRSARWAAENGFHLLVGNINTAEETDGFFEVQRSHIETFRAHWKGESQPRIAVGRVIVPLDGADTATRQRYHDYAASRHARTLGPQGERRTQFTSDLVGTAAELIERLAADPILPLVDTLRLELPYNFSIDDYRQITADFAGLIAPALGWRGGVELKGAA